MEFADKKRPITDIEAQELFSLYDVPVNKIYEFWRYVMRHMLMRLVIGLVWIVAAVISIVKLNFSMAICSGIVGIFFLYNAYSIWRKREGK